MIRPLKSRHILTIKQLILMYVRSKVLQRLLINALPIVEKINSGVREAIDSCTIAAKEGLHIQATTIESVDSIGRYEENKSRPIKVLFNNKTDQTRVLRNLGNLKQAEQKI